MTRFVYETKENLKGELLISQPLLVDVYYETENI